VRGYVRVPAAVLGTRAEDFGAMRGGNMKGEKADAFWFLGVIYGERQLLGAERLYTKHTEVIIPILETLLIIFM
jgi:hypothetical protein